MCAQAVVVYSRPSAHGRTNHDSHVCGGEAGDSACGATTAMYRYWRPPGGSEAEHATGIILEQSNCCDPSAEAEHKIDITMEQ